MEQNAGLQPQNIASIAKIRLIDASNVDDLDAKVCVALRMIGINDDPVRRRGIGLRVEMLYCISISMPMFALQQMRKLAVAKIKINKNKGSHRANSQF